MTKTFAILFIGSTLNAGCSLYQSPGRECVKDNKDCGSVTINLSSHELRNSSECFLDQSEDEALNEETQVLYSERQTHLTAYAGKQRLSCTVFYQNSESQKQDEAQVLLDFDQLYQSIFY